MFFSQGNFIRPFNKICFHRIFFEFPPTGGILPKLDFHTVKLLRYVNPMDYFVMACEFVYIAFIIYYIIEEIIEIRKNGFKYFRGVWNLLDLTVIAVSYLAVITSKIPKT